jgi:signal transduction histidine kinase
MVQAYRNERAAVATKLLGTVRAVAGVVDGEVEKAQILLKTISASDALARDDLKTVDSIARRALAEEERWLAIVAPDGSQLINTRARVGAPLPPINVDPEFAQAMQRGDPYVSNLTRGPVAQALVVHVSRPYPPRGPLKYSLAVVMLPHALARSIGIDRYAPGSVLTIADRNAAIIARTHNPDKYVGHSITEDMVKITAERREGISDSVTLENIPVMVAFTRTQGGWIVLLGAPKAELYSSARRLLVLGLASSALLALIAIAMAVWIGRAVVRSMDALTEQAATLGAGRTPVAPSTGLKEPDFVARTMQHTAEALLRRTRTLETLNRVSTSLVAERDLQRIVQIVTDAGRDCIGAEVGAFFYRADHGEPPGRTECAVSGLSAEAFDRLRRSREPSPEREIRAPELVCSPDVAADPRFGPDRRLSLVLEGNRPVRSYLALPVRSPGGDSLGELMFAHAAPNVFTAEAQEIVTGLAAEAAIAIENAKLYHTLARELAAKTQIEGALRLAQQDLEKKVEERTASLRAANAQMEEFSYTVSHDLRSPLRAMRGFADVLSEDYAQNLDATAIDYLNRIKRAAERMDRLTTDVLSYSRIARAEVQLAPTEIDRIIVGTIEHYPELQPANADVLVQRPLPVVLAYEPALTQALANLLTNAVKFVRPGERPHVTVRAETNGPHVRIWIEDRGIGIAPEYQNALFKMFERAPTRTRYEGTGVGLAIVRKAVEKMGGSCGVESDGKSGSRFWIELAAA